jgi:hypothetical protein
VGHIPPSWPISTALPAQPISAKLARIVFLPGSMPSGPRCLADRTRQPLSIAGGNRYAPELLWGSVASQTHPLPLLLAALPASEIRATPRPKVLHPRLCELLIASLHLPPRLWTAGKPLCRRGVASSCCVDRSLSSLLNCRDAGAKHPVTVPRAAPLLPPSLLASRAALSSLQLHSSALHRHHQPPPCLAHLLTNGVRTNNLHARPLPLRRRCCTLLRAYTPVALLPHQAVTSLSASLRRPALPPCNARL